jgi:hypothetical protein
MKENRHCEEPLGDEAIQGCSTVLVALDCFAASAARNDGMDGLE